MSSQESPEQIAAREEAAEEEARRETRRKSLADQERNRRQREQDEADKERRRQEARDKAAAYAEKRATLEEFAEGQLQGLLSTIQELQSVDAEHVRALAAAGERTGTLQRQPVSQSIREWIKRGLLDKLSEQVRSTPGPDLARSLAALDPLTNTPEGEDADTSPRHREPGPAHATLDSLQAEEENARQRAKEQRRRREETDTGKRRAPDTGELVAAETIEG